MSRVENIIQEIEALEDDELELLLQVLLKRLDKRRRMKEVFDKYRGIGKGVWPSDAQAYINQLREDRHGVAG